MVKCHYTVSNVRGNVVDVTRECFAFFGLSKTMDATYVTAALIFSIAGGILVYRFIERPMLLLLQRRRAPISSRAKALCELDESGHKIGEVK